MSMKDRNCILPDLIYLDTLGDMTYLDPFSISKWNNEKIFELSSEEYYLCSINGERVSEQQEISTVTIDFLEDLTKHNFCQTFTTNKSFFQRLSPILEISDNEFSDNSDTKQKTIKNTNLSDTIHISENKSINDSTCGLKGSFNENTVSSFSECIHESAETSKNQSDTCHISTIIEISHPTPAVSNMNSHYGK